MEWLPFWLWLRPGGHQCWFCRLFRRTYQRLFSYLLEVYLLRHRTTFCWFWERAMGVVWFWSGNRPWSFWSIGICLWQLCRPQEPQRWFALSHLRPSGRRLGTGSRCFSCFLLRRIWALDLGMICCIWILDRLFPKCICSIWLVFFPLLYKI